MHKKVVLALLLAILGLGLWQTAAGAVIYRMRFQVNTMNLGNSNPPGKKQVNVNIQVSDSKQRPYDAVKTLMVSDPDGKTANFKETWNESAGAFIFSIPAEAITTLNGTYKAVVLGFDNSQITQTMKIDGKFLGVVKITSPPTGPVDTFTPTLTWNAVSNATCYNVNIQQVGYTFWAYPTTPTSTKPLSFTVPTGVLKPGTNYTIIVNAFNSDKLLTKQSNGGVNITTPSAP